MDSVENLPDASIYGHSELSGRTSSSGKAAGVHLNVDVPASYSTDLFAAYSHNGPINETETRECNRLRAHAAAELDAKKRKLAEIDAPAEILRQQRERSTVDVRALSETLDVCARIGAPVRRIPFDVLREIAIYHFSQYPVPTFSYFNSSFTRVCTAWRDTALLSPRLWTTLFVRIGSPNSLKDDAVIEWFRRSSGLPTTFYFDLVPLTRGPTPSRQDLFHFCDSISSSLAHLSHLGIWAQDAVDLDALLKSPLPWAATELQQLDIRIDLFGTEAWGPSVLFRSLPSVTRLTLDFLPYRHATRYPSFALWKQLTYFRLSSEIEIEDWADLMELMDNLQIASFRLICPLGHSVVRRRPSTLPHLEHLSLVLDASCSSLSLCDIMQVHFFPMLKTLQLSRFDSDDEGSLSRSRPPTDTPSSRSLPDFMHLEQLSIKYSYDENLRPLFLRAPHLRTLTGVTANMIDEHVVGHRLLSELSHPGNGNRHVLPRLSYLHIACSARRIQPPDMDAFVNLILAMRPVDHDNLPCGCDFLEHATIIIPSDAAVKELTMLTNECVKRASGGSIEILYGESRFIDYQVMPHMRSLDDVLWN